MSHFATHLCNVYHYNNFMSAGDQPGQACCLAYSGAKIYIKPYIFKILPKLTLPFLSLFQKLATLSLGSLSLRSLSIAALYLSRRSFSLGSFSLFQSLTIFRSIFLKLKASHGLLYRDSFNLSVILKSGWLLILGVSKSETKLPMEMIPNGRLSMNDSRWTTLNGWFPIEDFWWMTLNR